MNCQTGSANPLTFPSAIEFLIQNFLPLRAFKKIIVEAFLGY